MALDIFKTHTMLAAVQELNPLYAFIRDRYFPTNDTTDLFSTDDVLVEYRDGNRKRAPFVVPRKGGVAVLREGYGVKRYTPPYIAPKRSLTIDDLNKKGFGESLYSQLTPAQRQGALMMKDFEELDEMIVRREESMAAETLLNSGCVMKHITDDPNKPEEFEIHFYDGGSNPYQYTPGTDWDKPGADILGDIYTVAEQLAKRGLPASDLIVAPDVGSAILADEKLLKLFDIKSVQVGGIDPEKLPNGVTKLGRLNCKGHVVDVLQYSETYTDDEDKSVQFIPAGKAILTAPGCGRTLYGAVSQVEQSDGEFHTYTGKRVPKYLSDANSNTREVFLTARPLCIPVRKGAWVTINAINPAKS